MNKGINRRDFFKVAAVSGAAAAVAGCGSDPVEEILPMLIPPTEYVPGTSISFATTCNECSASCGMVVRTREGRAIKAEGNPKNPLNNGSLCTIGQSSMQGMYSPSRMAGPAKLTDGNSTPISWEEGKKLFLSKLKAAKSNDIVYLSAPKSGSIQKLKNDFVNAFGGGSVLEFDTASTNSVKAANKLCFGKNEIPHYAIEDAKFLVSFGADFLESWMNPAQATKAYAKMHAYHGGEKGKYVYVGSHMTMSGTNADRWVTCKTGTEAQVALAVAKEIAGNASGWLGTFLNDFDKAAVAERTGVSVDQINELAKEFKKGGKSLAIAGGNGANGKDATQLQVAVNVLNHVAGNINKTVKFGADYQLGGDSLTSILKALNKGPAVVVIENTNPVFALPAESGIKEAIKKAGFVVSLSTEADETSALADLHLPVAHYMESWGDSRARNGVYGLQQPVMAKLPGFDTMQLGDLLIDVSSNSAGDTQTYLKKEWKKVQKATGKGGSFDSFWKQSLQDGGVFGDFRQTSVAIGSGAAKAKPSTAAKAEGLKLLAVNSNLQSANGHTGNRTWLLEVAHPVTQLVWDSWVELHPNTAIKLGIRHGDLVEVSSSKGKVEVAAWVYYGIDEGTVAMPAGLGRIVPLPTYISTRGKSLLIPHVEMAGDVTIKGQKVGENVMDLVTFAQDSISGDLAFNETTVTLKSTGTKAFMVSPEGMNRDNSASLEADQPAGMGDRSQKDRGFIQITSPEVLNGSKEAEHYGHALKKRHYTTDKPSNVDFYDERSVDIKKHADMAGKDKPVYYDPYKWEMSIDLDRCTGCSACVVACYAENNIPVVGKERMSTGREMNWIRIERYIEHDKATGELETYYTPEMCNQCENAGCETVCPVYATYHNEEGINAMIYNRCVGTRYCANNCIYKQRRFNWRTYEFPNPLHMQLNPAVTVREKGVMEKCNFCNSRIREAKDLAKDQGREVYDGDIKTACQQTCGADAITFGNIKDPKSMVSAINTTSERTYKQLEEVNYKPSITYLKKVKLDNRKA